MTRHLHVVGARARDRRPILEQPAGVVFASCHQGLRGPYTGVDTVLWAVLSDVYAKWPELVDYHRLEIIEYSNIQFTKAPEVLRGMGLALDKNDKARKELADKGMAPE